jgi:hypothetical protein
MRQLTKKKKKKKPQQHGATKQVTDGDATNRWYQRNLHTNRQDT